MSDEIMVSEMKLQRAHAIVFFEVDHCKMQEEGRLSLLISHDNCKLIFLYFQLDFHKKIKRGEKVLKVELKWLKFEFSVDMKSFSTNAINFFLSEQMNRIFYLSMKECLRGIRLSSFLK